VAPAPWVALRAARAELADGDAAAAARRLGLARERHPEDFRLALRHAAVLETLGRAEQALLAREAAHAAAPLAVAPANDLAWSLASQGRDLDRALALAQGAIARGGEDPALLDTLATVQLARGDAEAARDAVARALPASRGTTREHLLELQAKLQDGQAP
jgi:Flp pilus assembly protein TadD